MASGSAGGSSRGGGRTGGNGRKYTAAKNRRVTERYTTANRATRRSIKGGVNAVPSRWFM